MGGRRGGVGKSSFWRGFLDKALRPRQEGQVQAAAALLPLLCVCVWWVCVCVCCVNASQNKTCEVPLLITSLALCPPPTRPAPDRTLPLDLCLPSASRLRPPHVTHPLHTPETTGQTTNGYTQRRGSCGASRSVCFFPPLLSPSPAPRPPRARAAPPQLRRGPGAHRGDSAHARA